MAFDKDRAHKTLKSMYPKIFVEMELEPKLKHQNSNSNSVNNGLCWVDGKASKLSHKRPDEEEEEEWDDSVRYRDNFAKLQQQQFCLYHVNGQEN